MPSARSASASGVSHCGAKTPTSSRLTPAGLESGPSRLKIVRVPSSTRLGPTKRIAAWWLGANMKPRPASAIASEIWAGDRLDVDAESRQDVGRPGLRGEGAVAVLGDGHAAAGKDEGRAGGDVDRASMIAAGADDVDRIRRRLHAQHVRAHHRNRAGDLVDGLATHPERHQEAADLRGRRLAGHHRREGGLGFGAGQAVAIGDLGEERFQRGAHRTIALA